jgi:O-antigen/teichoic acid export membrane protein
MVKSELPSAARWGGVATFGREGFRIVCTVLIARLLGTEEFGIAAQAMAYMGIVSILVDQGFGAALVQRKHLEPEVPGATVTVNLVIGAALTVTTIAIASRWAAFMHNPALTLVLIVLSSTLLLGSAYVTPRAILVRNMQFRKINFVEMISLLCSGILGVAVAIIWVTYWAVVVQMVVGSIVRLLAYFFSGAGVLPNLKLRKLRPLMAFSMRTFLGMVGTGSISKNVDNVLIGRFQGPDALALYSLAYRLLLVPHQLISYSMFGFLFPAFSRLADDVPALNWQLVRMTRVLATLMLPALALVAAAAPQLVSIVFGSDWERAVPVVRVLTFACAAQAIYGAGTYALGLGVGRSKLLLRYSLVTSTGTTVGIIAGLPFGPLGVAVGYSAATGLLLPVEWLIRRHILGQSVGGQIALLLPGCHVAIWVAATYLLVAKLIPHHDLAVAAMGFLLATLAGAAVLRLAHRRRMVELIFITGRMMGRDSGSQSAAG